MNDTILDAWTPQSDLAGAEAVDLLRQAVRSRLERESPPPGMLYAGTSHGIGMLGSRMVRPHVDADSREWALLWILDAGQDHAIFVADHIPRGCGDTTRRPTKSPTFQAALRPGTLVLFNAHRTHWMPGSQDGSTMTCCSLEFHARPTRAAAERHLAQALRYLPKTRRGLGM